jgi:acyl carrier protein
MEQEVVSILHEVLSLNAQANVMHRESPLLGALPELDSMSVAALITTLEERFGFSIADDEIDASSFSTVGTLTDFVTHKAGRL